MTQIGAGFAGSGTCHLKSTYCFCAHMHEIMKYLIYVDFRSQLSVIDLKSTYWFCAHMHEIMKYFLLTENQQQFLNSEHASDPANPEAICVILMRSSCWYYVSIIATTECTRILLVRRQIYIATSSAAKRDKGQWFAWWKTIGHGNHD